MTDWIDIFFKAFWCGWAALGFGILFNVPVKALLAIWIGGAIAGLIKFTVLLAAPSYVILAPFLSALSVAVFSISVAQIRHEPPMIFSIPSVITLVPGVFAYRTMLGLMKLTENVGTNYMLTLSKTVHNGVTTLFIIMSIAIGVAIPMNIMGKNIGKKFQLRK